MKTTITIAILLIVNTSIYAQVEMKTSLASLKTNSTTVLTWNDPIEVGFSSELEEIKEGPYYNNEWLKGRVLLKDGQKLGKDWLFKYNIFQDELHIRLQSGEVKVPLKSQIQSFMVVQNEKQHYFVNSDLSGVAEEKSNRTFLEVLHSNRFTLLKRSSKHYEEVENDGFYCSTCDNSPMDFFLTSKKYYLKEKGKRFKKIKLKKKSLFRAFPQHKTLIQYYLKENNIKLKSEIALLNLLQHIEESQSTLKL